MKMNERKRLNVLRNFFITFSLLSIGFMIGASERIILDKGKIDFYLHLGMGFLILIIAFIIKKCSKSNEK